MPHVTRPSCRHATIGNVPAGPRWSNGGAWLAEHEVEHPAGAERDLGVARAARSPDRRARPAGRRAARRSAARRAARWPRRRRRYESTIVGSISGGMPSTASTCGSHADGSRATCSPVMAAFVASVTCTRAARQRPRDPRVDGAEAEVATRARGRGAVRAATAPWSPTGSGRRARPAARSVEARADRAEVLPADARADGFAGRAVPHDGRAALVRDADRGDRTRAARARRSRARGTCRPSRARRTARCRRPGESGSSSRSTLCATVPCGVVRRRRGRCSSRRRRRAPRSSHVAHGQASSPNGLRRPSLPGFRMPFGSSASFTDCSTPKPAPSASAHEPRPVEADAVVVRERAARGEHRALARRPTPRGSTPRARRRAGGPRT